MYNSESSIYRKTWWASLGHNINSCYLGENLNNSALVLPLGLWGLYLGEQIFHPDHVICLLFFIIWNSNCWYFWESFLFLCFVDFLYLQYFYTRMRTTNGPLWVLSSCLSFSTKSSFHKVLAVCFDAKAKLWQLQ